MSMNALMERIHKIVRPIADELNYEIYHIEYVKEDGEYYLRIYITKEEGIALSDCEKLSRRVSEMMDIEDPIEDSYFLEVSSPGLNRGLFTEKHYRDSIDKEVLIRFTKSLGGKRNITGILKDVTEDSLIIEADEIVTIPMDKIKSANLEGEI